MDSLQGHFLVASPQMGDPNFARTVVLLVEHTADGALGLVLNRPTGKTVGQLLSELGATELESERPLYIGGPVPGPLMSIHNNSNLGEVEIIAGVYLSAKKAHLDELIRQHDGRLKVFLGHSGWGPGQLDREMEEGAWLSAPAEHNSVFEADADLWSLVCKRIGSELLRDSLGIKRFPDDPSMN